MKTNHHSTKRPAVSKNKKPVWDIEMYLGMIPYRNEYTKEQALAFGADLIRMVVEDPAMVTIEEWINKHSLATSTIAIWCKKFPEFKEMYLDAKERIGLKISKKALTKEFDASYSRFIIPWYSKDARKDRAARAKLTEKSKGDTKIEVVMPPIISLDDDEPGRS